MLMKYPWQFTSRRLCPQQWGSSASFQRTSFFNLEIDLNTVIRLNRHLNLCAHQCLGTIWTMASWGWLITVYHPQPSNDSKHFTLTVPRSDHEESWLGVLPEGRHFLNSKQLHSMIKHAVYHSGAPVYWWVNKHNVIWDLPDHSSTSYKPLGL